MKEITDTLNEKYRIKFDHLELMRDMGSTSFAVVSNGCNYFLCVINPAFYDTAITGADIQVFLQNQGFPVPPIIFTKEDLPYARTDDKLIILYEFIVNIAKATFTVIKL